MEILSFVPIMKDIAVTSQLGSLVDVSVLSGGISLFVPIVVAFITKKEASDRVKAVANLLGVGVASVIALFINGNAGQPITWQVVVATFVTGLIASLAAYKGAWKPVGVTPAIASATENFGIGQPVPAVPETARPGGDVRGEY